MENQYQQWLWEKIGHECIENLKKHWFDAHFVQTIEEARQLALKMISGYESFGFAGSETARKIGLIEELKAKGKTVYDHWQPGLSKDEDMDIRRHQQSCDCFLCSANAISMTGEVINVDGAGNRTSAMAFGPKKVVIIAGMNKVTSDIDSGIRRIREIAGPMRAKSLGMDTPCAHTGICNDCNAPQRICRITTILHRKPMKTDVSVILINQPLGF